MKIDPRWIGRKKRLRTYAEANGISVPKGFRINPYCGSACRELIRRVTRHVWGRAAETDKWPGALDAVISPKLTTPQRALKIARGEIGVKETPAGSNSGPRVREFQNSTSLSGTTGWPWCAAFVCWSYDRAGRKFSGFNTAYVPSYVRSAKENAHGLRLVRASDARPGDLVCFDWGGDGVADHIGVLATRVSGGNTFASVEGNTSYGNDSNGGEVMLRDRNVGQVQVFIRVL